ncbi:hypothetical protein ACLOJK_014930 [Asimina triloba]
MSDSGYLQPQQTDSSPYCRSRIGPPGNRTIKGDIGLQWYALTVEEIATLETMERKRKVIAVMKPSTVKEEADSPVVGPLLPLSSIRLLAKIDAFADVEVGEAVEVLEVVLFCHAIVGSELAELGDSEAKG